MFPFLNRPTMIDCILHYSLFNTGKERMTASSSSLHVMEEPAFGRKSKKTPKTPQRHDKKDILPPIYFSLCVLSYVLW